MENLTISFSADNSELTNTTGKKLVPSGTIGYIKADFSLGENWTDWDAVEAVWSTRKVTIAIPLNNGSCIVPHEVLATKETVRVNLVGYSAEGDELIERLTTFKVVAVSIAQNVEVEGGESDPSIISAIEGLVITAQEAAADAGESADNAAASEQNAEAWAIGERSGAPVDEEDEAYHNNAKYYSEQAEAAAQEAAEEAAEDAAEEVVEQLKEYKESAEASAAAAAGSASSANYQRAASEEAERKAKAAQDAAEQAAQDAASAFSVIGNVAFTVLPSGQVREIWTKEE